MKSAGLANGMYQGIKDIKAVWILWKIGQISLDDPND
jgi:hypothetical protein